MVGRGPGSTCYVSQCAEEISAFAEQMKPTTPTPTGVDAVDGSGTAPTASETQPLKPDNPDSRWLTQIVFLPFHIREKITHSADMFRFLLKCREYNNTSSPLELNLSHFVELTESLACRLSPSENKELITMVKQAASRVICKVVTDTVAKTIADNAEDGGYASLKSSQAGLHHHRNMHLQFPIYMSDLIVISHVNLFRFNHTCNFDYHWRLGVPASAFCHSASFQASYNRMKYLCKDMDEDPTFKEAAAGALTALTNRLTSVAPFPVGNLLQYALHVAVAVCLQVLSLGLLTLIPQGQTKSNCSQPVTTTRNIGNHSDVVIGEETTHLSTAKENKHTTHTELSS